jgi:hypothetical protein
MSQNSAGVHNWITLETIRATETRIYCVSRPGHEQDAIFDGCKALLSAEAGLREKFSHRELRIGACVGILHTPLKRSIREKQKHLQKLRYGRFVIDYLMNYYRFR